MRLTRPITNTVKAYTGYRKLSKATAAAKTRFNIAGCVDGPVMNSKNILEGYLIKKKNQSSLGG